MMYFKIELISIYFKLVARAEKLHVVKFLV